MLADGGRTLFKGSFDTAVAEVIVRSVLLGRENFQVPTKHKEAAAAVTAFLGWFDDLRMQLDAAIDDSALGTGYEELLRSEVYERLGIHPLAGERTLPHEITLSPHN